MNGGQVEQMLSDGSILYLNGNHIRFSFRNHRFNLGMAVNTTTATTATYLPTYFATTEETTGTWAFQGDGLTWTAPDIPRQNNGAFLACGSGVPGVYVNLGA